jgi:hypothetical protein
MSAAEAQERLRKLAAAQRGQQEAEQEAARLRKEQNWMSWTWWRWELSPM